MTHVFKTPKGQVFVGGLGPWKLLKSPNERTRSNEVKAEAERIASKFAVEYVREKDGVSFVAALPANAPKAALKAASAATVFAEQFPQDNVVYVEQLKDGRYWVLWAVQGELDPRYDTIGEHDEVVQWLDAILGEGVGLIPRVFLNVRDEPQSGMLVRADRNSADIASSLDSVKFGATHRVKQVSGVTATHVVAGFLAVVVLLGVAGGWYWQKKMERDRRFKREAQRTQEALAMQERIRTETELRIVKAVAESLQGDTVTPAPAALVEACLKTVDWVGPGIAGWQVTQVSCDAVTGQAATVSLARPVLERGWAGTTESLMDFATRHGVTASFDVNSGNASLVVPMSGVTMRAGMGLKTLPKQAEIEERLPTRLQLEQQANAEFQYQLTAPTPVSLRYRKPDNEDAIRAAGGQPEMVAVPPERGYRRGTASMTASMMWQLESLRIDWPYWSIKSLDVLVREGGDYQWRMEANYVAAY